MADSRFFHRAGPFVLSDLAQAVDAQVVGDGSVSVSDVAPLDAAGEQDLSFFDNRKYLDAFKATKARACVVAPDFVDQAPQGVVLLVTQQPYLAYALIAQRFYPEPRPEPALSDRATIDPDATIGADVRIDAGAVVESGAVIGARCHVAANAVIGAGVVLGDECWVGPNATVSHAILGARVRIYPGARVGQRGFGFAVGPRGFEDVPQIGRVMIGDDVEVGANTCIDRGAGPDTVIGTGTRIDNLVQIGHNVQIGKMCAIVAQFGASGSSKIGDFVQAGGQAGMAGHITIGTGAKIAAQSGVTKDVAPGATVVGFPARPAREFWRSVAFVERLMKKK